MAAANASIFFLHSFPSPLVFASNLALKNVLNHYGQAIFLEARALALPNHPYASNFHWLQHFMGA